MNTPDSQSVSLSGKHLCVQWPTLQPYHIARLEVLGALCAEESVHVTTLELSEVDLMGRGGGDATDALPFDRIMAFPTMDGRRIAPALVGKKIRSILTRLNPDVVAINSYSTSDARAALAWCLENSRATVLMTDSRKGDAIRVRWRESVKSILVSRCGAALVAGTPQVDYLKSLGFPADAIFTGYDVVDNDFFAAETDRIRSEAGDMRGLPGLGSDVPFYLAVGRIIRRKGMETLIDGYRRYRGGVSNPWRLVIVGDGVDLPRIRRLIEATHLEGVTLAGNQPHDALPSYYAHAGALVHAADSDQWGLVVNEAMASGLPVIVSDGAGSAMDLVQEGRNGFRFPARDAAALADCMSRLSAIDNVQAEMGVKSRAIIAEWSVDRFAASMLDAVRVALTRTEEHGSTDAARLLLRLLKLVAKKPTSFHTVEA